MSNATRPPKHARPRTTRPESGQGLTKPRRSGTPRLGEQYALPAAMEQLAAVRKAPRTGERVTIGATDPLNLVGLVVPGETVPAVRTNRVTYVDGLPT